MELHNILNKDLLTNLQPLVMKYSVSLISALLIFFIGKWLAGRLTRIIGTAMNKAKVDITLVKFLENILFYTLLVIVIIAAAGQMGINTASFLTVIGAASLAVGLALKDSLGNFSSGVILILFRPFKVGDVVTVGAETGSVQEITVFNTILNTGDNQRKIIPNGQITNSTITNITANPVRRIDLNISISHDGDLKKAKEILGRIVHNEPRILAEPAPLVAVALLGSASVELTIRPWVRTHDYWDVFFDLTEQIKLAFDAEAIAFPSPSRPAAQPANK